MSGMLRGPVFRHDEKMVYPLSALHPDARVVTIETATGTWVGNAIWAIAEKRAAICGNNDALPDAIVCKTTQGLLLRTTKGAAFPAGTVAPPCQKCPCKFPHRSWLQPQLCRAAGAGVRAHVGEAATSHALCYASGSGGSVAARNDLTRRAGREPERQRRRRRGLQCGRRR